MSKPTIQQYIEQCNGDAVLCDPHVLIRADVVLHQYKDGRLLRDGESDSEFQRWSLAESLIYFSHFIQAMILHENLFCLEVNPSDPETEFSIIHDVTHNIPFDYVNYPREVQKCIIDYYKRLASFVGIQRMTHDMSGQRADTFWWRMLDEVTSSLGPCLAVIEAGISCTCDPYFSEFVVPFVKETYKGKSFADICMSVMNEAMKEKALRLNKIREAPIYSTSIPMLFAKVLSLSSTPEDLLSHALEIRNTKAASRFREWASAVNNDSSCDNFEKEYNEVDKLAENLAKGIRRPSKEISIGFGIGLLSFSTPFAVPDIKLNRKKHLSFLSDNCWKVYLRDEIASGITRVFNVDGKDIVRRISSFKKIRPIRTRFGWSGESNREQL